MNTGKYSLLLVKIIPLIFSWLSLNPVDPLQVNRETVTKSNGIFLNKIELNGINFSWINIFCTYIGASQNLNNSTLRQTDFVQLTVWPKNLLNGANDVKKNEFVVAQVQKSNPV